MQYGNLIDALERFGGTVPAVVAGLSHEDARWRPDDGGWSILEVVAHLTDEETRDFRARVESTLTDASRPWPAIDPEGWARDEAYNERDLSDQAARFAAARRDSVSWLRGLDDPDWEATYHHPKLGPICAGDVFASWVAHDALHLRQIAKRMYQLARLHASEFRADYAGEWKA